MQPLLRRSEADLYFGLNRVGPRTTVSVEMVVFCFVQSVTIFFGAAAIVVRAWCKQVFLIRRRDWCLSG